MQIHPGYQTRWFLHVRNAMIHNLGLDILKTKYPPALRWGEAEGGKENLSQYSIYLLSQQSHIPLHYPIEYGTMSSVKNKTKVFN